MRFMEYLLQNIIMQNPKKQSSLAYAKFGKHKSKQHLSSTAPNFHQKTPSSNRQKQKQNLYQTLMGQLDQTDSKYIEKLCKKNENKNKIQERSTHKVNTKGIISQSTNLQNKKSNRGSVKQIIHDSPVKNLNFKKKDKNTDTTQLTLTNFSAKQKREQQGNKQQKQQLSLFLNSKLSTCFLKSIDSYIEILQQQPQKSYKKPQKPLPYTVQISNPKTFANSSQRSYRKTIQKYQKPRVAVHQNYISIQQYQDLIEKIQFLLQTKQQMQQQIAQNHHRIHQLSKITKKMHNQITELKERLHQQQQEKIQYRQLVDQLSSKIQYTRSKSKQKLSSYAALERNIHSPFSKRSHGRYRSMNADHFNQFMRQQEYRYMHACQKQYSRLRKKGAKHKFKKDFFRQDSDDPTPQKASIYNNCSEW